MCELAESKVDFRRIFPEEEDSDCARLCIWYMCMCVYVCVYIYVCVCVYRCLTLVSLYFAGEWIDESARGREGGENNLVPGFYARAIACCTPE